MKQQKEAHSSLGGLLLSDVGVVAALSLSALGGFSWESSIAFSANHFVNFVLSSQLDEGRLNLDGSHTSSSESEHEMES